VGGVRADAGAGRHPDALRRLLLGMSQVDNRALRISGLVSMLAGLGLLYLVR
jgi:uncharacterized protein YjeT (DUF2065 family)